MQQEDPKRIAALSAARVVRRPVKFPVKDFGRRDQLKCFARSVASLDGELTWSRVREECPSRVCEECLSIMLDDHTSGGNPVVLVRNGVVTCTSRGEITLRKSDGSGRTEIFPEGGGLRFIVPMSNGTFAVSDYDRVRCYDSDGQLLWAQKCHETTILCLLPMGDGWLATGSQDCSVAILDDRGAIVFRLMGHSKAVQDLAVLPDGRVVSGSQDHTARIWDLSPGWSEDEAKCDVLRGHSGGVTKVVPIDAERLASSSEDNTIIIWNTQTLDIIAVLGKLPFWVKTICVVGNDLVCGVAGPGLHAWDIGDDSYEYLGPLEEPKHSRVGSVEALIKLPGGMLAARYTDGCARVWGSVKK
jgi:WD40 repeat protein